MYKRLPNYINIFFKNHPRLCCEIQLLDLCTSNIRHKDFRSPQRSYANYIPNTYPKYAKICPNNAKEPKICPSIIQHTLIIFPSLQQVLMTGKSLIWWDRQRMGTFRPSTQYQLIGKQIYKWFSFGRTLQNYSQLLC